MFQVNPDEGRGDRIEEEFTLARLFLTKMKAEIKALSQKCAQLEEYQTDYTKKVEDSDKELSELRLKMQQVCSFIVT